MGNWVAKTISIDSTSWTPVFAESLASEVVIPAVAPDGLPTVNLKLRTAQGDPDTEFILLAGNELSLPRGKFTNAQAAMFVQTTSGTAQIVQRTLELDAVGFRLVEPF